MQENQTGRTQVLTPNLDLSSTDNQQLLLECVQQNLARGDHASAVRDLNAFASHQPLHPLPYILLTKLAAALQDQELAKNTFYAAAKSISNCPELFVEIGQAFEAFRNIDLAQQAYEKSLSSNFSQPSARLSLARLCRTHGKFPEALAHYATLTKLDPNHGEGWAGLALLSFQCGDEKTGFAALEKAREFAPSLEDFFNACSLAVRLFPHRSEGYLCLGHAQCARKEYGAAQESAQRAIASNHDSDEAYFLSASLFYLDGKFDAMLRMCAEEVKARERQAKRLGLDKLGIRFITYPYTGPIGHISLIEIFLKLDILGLIPKARTLIFSEGYCGNSHLLNYWEPYAHVLSAEEKEVYRPMKRYLAQGNNGYELTNGEFIHIYQAMGYAYKLWEQEKRGPLLSIKPEDFERGWKRMEAWGIPRGSWFVTLHVRDSGTTPDGKWKIPQRAARNAHLETYLPVIKMITDRGGYVVRMGDTEMPPLPPMKNVIDYAHSDNKEEWMDVFLFAENRFLIGSASGPAGVPPLFGKPVANTNWNCLVIFPPPSADLFMPKLFWSKKENRLLTFKEQIGNPAIHYPESLEHIWSLGLDLVDNSPDDIVEFVTEMLERCDGTVRYSEEDEALQTKFRAAVGASDRTGNSRIGRSYLRKYKQLLE